MIQLFLELHCNYSEIKNIFFISRNSLIPVFPGHILLKASIILILISPNKARNALVNPEIEKKLVKSYKVMKRVRPKINAKNFLKK